MAGFFFRVILKGDDSLKGIAEKFRMFLLLEGERNRERRFLKILEEVLKILKGMIFKICIKRGVHQRRFC